MLSTKVLLFKSSKLNLFDIIQFQRRARYNLYVTTFYGSGLVIFINLIGICYYKYVYLNSNKGLLSVVMLGLLLFVVFMVSLGFIESSLRINTRYFSIQTLLRSLTAENKEFIKLQRELQIWCREVEGVYSSRYIKFYLTKNYLIYTELHLSELVIIPIKKIVRVYSKYEYSIMEGYFWQLTITYQGIDGVLHIDKLIIPTWFTEVDRVLSIFRINME